jgi:hypothetical protein
MRWNRSRTNGISVPIRRFQHSRSSSLTQRLCHLLRQHWAIQKGLPKQEKGKRKGKKEKKGELISTSSVFTWKLLFASHLTTSSEFPAPLQIAFASKQENSVFLFKKKKTKQKKKTKKKTLLFTSASIRAISSGEDSSSDIPSFYFFISFSKCHS